MAAPTAFTKPLLIWARSKGGDVGDVLEAAIAANMEAVVSGSGKQLLSASANGKSFTFGQLAGLSQDKLGPELTLALEIYGEIGATEESLTRFIRTRPPSRTVARFRPNYSVPGLYQGI